MKYSLSLREMPRVEPKGFPEDSGYISLFISTQFIIQTLSISKIIHPVLFALVGQYWNILFSCIALVAGPIFSSIHPVDASLVYIIQNVANKAGQYCILIRTRGGIYAKIWPEPEGLP